ncbi:MAG: DUF3298 and DUF4163 domain-containing protein [Oscillospiraceae bacterium]|jgi:hypothetical protein|nr:DUF3298 and DUF4163 domain-containing protein [Oscillospiraceae bacterium]
MKNTVKRRAAILMPILLTAVFLHSCGAKNPPAVTANPPSALAPSAPGASDAVPTATEPAEDSAFVYYEDIPIKNGAALSAYAAYPGGVSAAVDAYYSEVMSAFKNTARNLASDLAEYDDISPGVSYTLGDTYEITFQSDHLLSVLRTITADTGGAHESADITCETFVLPSGRRAPLLEFFTAPRAEYIGRIAALFDEYVEETGAELFFPNTAEYFRENFPEDYFTIMPYGLAFHFPPLTIAPYSMSTITITIPSSALEDIFTLPAE